ncbi:hypothetical protein JCM10213_003709 [Rhodosporidiobolus nylandii]
MSTSPRLPSILALATLLLAVASAQPARFPCGTTFPQQSVCDLLSHPVSRRIGVTIPIGSQCISDQQCDFGQCSGSANKLGLCIGGLGDLCEGPDGPDDSLCQGNLGCQRRTDGVLGKAVCGGSGADCSFSGAYEPGSKPNHLACQSGHCDAATLTCSSPPPPPPGRPQAPIYRPDSPFRDTQQRIVRVPVPPQPAPSRQRLSIPGATSCPTGFTLCPTRSPRGAASGFELVCVDATSSLTHCGGCPTIGAGFWDEDGEEGVDCMTIEGVASAACVDSKCRIFSCSAGFEFDRETGGCVRKRYW